MLEITDPLLIAVIKLYSAQRRILYLNNFQNFKLLVSWLLETEYGEWPVFDGSLVPWYSNNYEVTELAKILKCSPVVLIETLKSLEN